MMNPNILINGDAVTVLRHMESECIDVIITDPPYGVDYQSRRRKATPRKDKIANDKSPFIWWLYDAFRVLTCGGGYCVSAGGMFSRCSLTQ
jgi:site-specific DNA-methyltransferase (adenine-specific)